MSTEMTEANKHQEATAMEDLTPKQAAALDALLGGITVTAAAQSAGVDRRTLHRWLSEDPAFRAAYRRERRDYRQAAACAMERMAGNAIATLEDAILDGNVNAAVQLLKGIHALRPAAWRYGRPALRRRKEEEDHEDTP